MKRITIVLLIFALLAMTACGGKGTLEISFTNDTDKDLKTIHICEYGSDSIGSDLLGATTILKAGGTLKLKLESVAESGIYDIHCEDDDDTWLTQRVPISKGTSLSVYLNDDGIPVVVVTDSKGNTSEILGEFEGLEPVPSTRETTTATTTKETTAATTTKETTAATTTEETTTATTTKETTAATTTKKVIQAPSADDPLDMTYNLKSFPGEILIPYPSTMRVIRESETTPTIWLDALNDPDYDNNICVDFIQINNFDKYFTSGESQARVGLDKLFAAVIDVSYSDYYIQSTASEFVNGGTYYGLRHYMWFSGNYWGDEIPIRAVLELRYYGPTGYLLAVLTTTADGAIERYFSVASKIADAIPLGGDWSTGVSNSDSWSDPGDWDYDPWSDAGDGDGFDYSPYEIDPWSDPGDGEDFDYDPYEIDPWSDPGDTGD
ncbi:MAG TPA: hypothetical protein GXZ43_05505 [Clostridiaceae bacterium]|nr:hypothetical protein [Clostridiaceae bacterium]